MHFDVWRLFTCIWLQYIFWVLIVWRLFTWIWLQYSFWVLICEGCLLEHGCDYKFWVLMFQGYFHEYDNKFWVLMSEDCAISYGYKYIFFVIYAIFNFPFLCSLHSNYTCINFHFLCFPLVVTLELGSWVRARDEPTVDYDLLKFPLLLTCLIYMCIWFNYLSMLSSFMCMGCRLPSPKLWS